MVVNSKSWQQYQQLDHIMALNSLSIHHIQSWLSKKEEWLKIRLDLKTFTIQFHSLGKAWAHETVPSPAAIFRWHGWSTSYQRFSACLLLFKVQVCLVSKFQHERRRRIEFEIEGMNIPGPMMTSATRATLTTDPPPSRTSSWRSALGGLQSLHT